MLIPAHNGTEKPFLTKTGRLLLYVWNPQEQAETGRDTHVYLDVEKDIVLSHEEAFALIHP